MDFQLHGVECNYEFWPVEHPVEPMEEDQPVKCPISHTSAPINDNEDECEKQSNDVLRRKVKPLAVKDKKEMLVMRKRHHRLNHININTGNSSFTMSPVYPYPPPNASHKFQRFSHLKS